MKIIDTVTVSKIGTGTEDDPIRPNSSESWWQKIEETETTFTIQILAVEGG